MIMNIIEIFKDKMIFWWLFIFMFLSEKLESKVKLCDLYKSKHFKYPHLVFQMIIDSIYICD